MPSQVKNRPSGTIMSPGVSVVSNHWVKAPLPKHWVPFAYSPAYPITRHIGTESNLQTESGSDGAFRPCSHDTTVYQANPVQDNVLVWSYLGNSGGNDERVSLTGFQRQLHQYRYSNYKSAITGVSTSVDSIGWAALAQSSLESILPSLGGENSLVNFVLELKDFRRVAMLLKTRVSGSFSSIESLFGFSRSEKSAKKLSKAYLSYQFGWAPLYRDLVSLVSTMTNFESRLKGIKDQANTDLQGHFGITVSGTSVSQSTYYSSAGETPPGGGGFKGDTRVIRDSSPGVKYNATLRYRYPLPPELAGTHGELKALLDSLGVSSNPAIIWNAIPFSFLIDWVVNVGSWLNRLRVDNIRFQTEIRDFCHSAKFTRAIRYEQRVAQGYSDVNGNLFRSFTDWYLSDSCVKTSYRRKKGIPNFLTAFQTTGLNLREFSLGGALIGANHRSKR